DDEAAKERVTALVRAGGMRAVDTGPLRRARELESMGFLNMAVQDKLGTGYQSALKFISSEPS
ncbi:MAG TPA: hypothetical protein VFQ15_02590, partial [Jiangellaceae bacterium]|nr:hypothetical protein [Jiangellaceae bacterium]